MQEHAVLIVLVVLEAAHRAFFLFARPGTGIKSALAVEKGDELVAAPAIALGSVGGAGKARGGSSSRSWSPRQSARENLRCSRPVSHDLDQTAGTSD
jgi:hypothetical protein